MKRACTHNGFSIYERSDNELRQALDSMGCVLPRYEIYLPDESPEAQDAAE